MSEVHIDKKNIADIAQVYVVTPFEVVTQSGIEATRHCLDDVTKALAPLALDVDELSTLQLVLAEVINNIVEHAYPEGGPAGLIQTACEHVQNGLHFTITDTGFAMPRGETPLGMSPSIDTEIQDLPEGGFGWFLIKDLAKDVTYERVGNENRLRLRVSVGSGRTLPGAQPLD